MTTTPAPITNSATTRTATPTCSMMTPDALEDVAQRDRGDVGEGADDPVLHRRPPRPPGTRAVAT